MGNECCCECFIQPQPRRSEAINFADVGQHQRGIHSSQPRRGVGGSNLLGGKATGKRVYTQYDKHTKQSRPYRQKNAIKSGIDNSGLVESSDSYANYPVPPAVHKTRRRFPANNEQHCRHNNSSNQPQSARNLRSPRRKPDNDRSVPRKSNEVSYPKLGYVNDGFHEDESIFSDIVVRVVEVSTIAAQDKSRLDRSYSAATTISANDITSRPMLKVRQIRDSV